MGLRNEFYTVYIADDVRRGTTVGTAKYRSTTWEERQEEMLRKRRMVWKKTLTKTMVGNQLGGLVRK